MAEQDYEELKDRFGRILGRTPTEAEKEELVADILRMGLSLHDPLVLQLMAFKRERIELDKRLNGLTQIFHRHEQTMQKQLEEARDQVLKEADKALVKKGADLTRAGLSEMKTALEVEKTRLLELHRKELTDVVRITTKIAVSDQFSATWMTQWNGLMKQFSDDWNSKVEPRMAELNGALHHIKTMGWIWFGVALLLAGVIGLGGGWWFATKYGAPVVVVAPQNPAPAKPVAPGRK